MATDETNDCQWFRELIYTFAAAASTVALLGDDGHFVPQDKGESKTFIPENDAITLSHVTRHGFFPLFTGSLESLDVVIIATYSVLFW